MSDPSQWYLLGVLNAFMIIDLTACCILSAVLPARHRPNVKPHYYVLELAALFGVIEYAIQIQSAKTELSDATHLAVYVMSNVTLCLHNSLAMGIASVWFKLHFWIPVFDQFLRCCWNYMGCCHDCHNWPLPRIKHQCHCDLTRSTWGHCYLGKYSFGHLVFDRDCGHPSDPLLWCKGAIRCCATIHG